MARFFLFLLFFSLSAVSGFAGVKDSIGVTKINDQLHLRYLVEPGETIYGISTRYQVSVSDLLELNPELENGLKVGQVINIPYYADRIAKAKEREKAVVHKVQAGETLYSLAKRYNTSVDQLMKWNNMDLKAGQEIVVGYKDQPKTVKPEKEEKTEEAAKVASKETESAEKSTTKTPVEETKEVVKEASTVPAAEKTSDVYPFDPDAKQVMVIPFDPYLYFSDADHEIAAKSKIAPPKVREVFRRRLNTLLRAPGYETIHLLGGQSKDSIGDLNRVYSSVSYGYQDAIDNPHYQPEDIAEGQVKSSTKKSWIDKQKEKFVAVQNSSKAVHDKYEGQYFAVKIRNPEEFFSYFRDKYSVDYFIFINQFEVKTNYENCLDRAAHDFERTFTTHFSIFDAEGNQIAGNKFKTFYNSNSSYIYTIVADNMGKIAQRILAELPAPSEE